MARCVLIHFPISLSSFFYIFQVRLLLTGRIALHPETVRIVGMPFCAMPSRGISRTSKNLLFVHFHR